MEDTDTRKVEDVLKESTYWLHLERDVTNKRKQKVIIAEHGAGKLTDERIADLDKRFKAVNCDGNRDKLLDKADWLSGYKAREGEPGYKFTVTKELEPGVWEARWVYPREQLHPSFRKRNKAHRLRHPERAKAIIKVPCVGGNHKIALIGKSLVLCNHPRHEVDAAFTVDCLGDEELKLPPCLKILKEWQTFDDSDKPYDERLPKKLLELRLKQRLPLRGRCRRYRKASPVDRAHPLQMWPQPEPFDKDKWQLELLLSWITQQIKEHWKPTKKVVVAPYGKYDSSASIREDHYGIYITIDPRKWIRTLYKPGLWLNGQALLLEITPVDGYDLFKAYFVACPLGGLIHKSTGLLRLYPDKSPKVISC